MNEAEEQIKALEEKRAKRIAAQADEKTKQLAIDLAALDALEEEHGPDSVAQMDPGSYCKGLPTFIVVRAPGAEYKRYVDMIRRSGKDFKKAGEAMDLIGKSCIVYPKGEQLEAMTEAFPGINTSAGIRVLKFVEFDSAEEKKG